MSLLSQMPPLLSLPVCDPTQSCAFPMNVIALLPYMLLHFEDANEVCIRSAENIAQVASELGAKLENLGTVMTLYSRRNFSKDTFQWTKCVVKYLYDTYAHMGKSCRPPSHRDRFGANCALLGLHMLAFLVEVLEKGMPQVQVPVLNVIHCMLHYIDLSSPLVQPISGDLVKVIAKYLDVSTQIKRLPKNESIYYPRPAPRSLNAEQLLERRFENTEASRHAKFDAASCAPGIARRHFPPLLRQLQRLRALLQEGIGRAHDGVFV